MKKKVGIIGLFLGVVGFVSSISPTISVKAVTNEEKTTSDQRAISLRDYGANSLMQIWETDSEMIQEGVKASTTEMNAGIKIPGYAPLDENLAAQFNIENGNSVSIEFSIDLRDSNDINSVIHGSDWDETCFFVYITDVDTGNDLCAVKYWTNTQYSCAVELFDLTNNWASYSCHFWASGAAMLTSSFQLKFDKTNLVQCLVNAWGQDFWAVMDNSSSDDAYGESTRGGFYNAMHDKFADVKNISFRIEGNHGWRNGQTVILRSINGMSLADTNEYVNLTVDGTATKVIKGTVPTVEEPTKEGYTFTGWTDLEGNAVDLTLPLENDLSIVSNWKENIDETKLVASYSAFMSGTDALNGIRFVGSVNNQYYNDVSKFGFNITLKENNITKRHESAALYDTLNDTAENTAFYNEDEVFTKEGFLSFGLMLTDIPADLNATIEFYSFAVINGVEYHSTTQTVTIENGSIK